MAMLLAENITKMSRALVQAIDGISKVGEATEYTAKSAIYTTVLTAVGTTLLTAVCLPIMKNGAISLWQKYRGQQEPLAGNTSQELASVVVAAQPPNQSTQEDEIKGLKELAKTQEDEIKGLKELVKTLEEKNKHLILTNQSMKQTIEYKNQIISEYEAEKPTPKENKTPPVTPSI